MSLDNSVINTGESWFNNSTPYFIPYGPVGGYAGPIGPTGLNFTGATGTQGVTGPTLGGSTGNTGPTGGASAGITGQTGGQGGTPIAPTGATGPAGPNISSNQFAILVQTTSPSATITVQNFVANYGTPIINTNNIVLQNIGIWYFNAIIKITWSNAPASTDQIIPSITGCLTTPITLINGITIFPTVSATSQESLSGVGSTFTTIEGYSNVDGINYPSISIAVPRGGTSRPYTIQCVSFYCELSSQTN